MEPQAPDLAEQLDDPNTWDGLTVTDTVGFVVDEQGDEESESLNRLLSDWFDGDEEAQTTESRIAAVPMGLR